MANETVYLSGPVLFACVFDRNKKQNEYTDEHGEYTIVIGLDKPAAKMVKGWNKMYQGKELDEIFKQDKMPPEAEDEEFNSLTYFTFKRKAKVFKRDGTEIEDFGGKPVTVDSDGNPWDDDINIGNFSKATIKLNVYRGTFQKDGKTAPFTQVRLDAVKVDELVEYEGSERQPAEIVMVGNAKPF